MSRKSVFALTFAMLGILAVIFGFSKPQPALAQDNTKVGTIEGIITDSEGEPLTNGGNAPIELFLDGQSVGVYYLKNGGLYHIENLKKGIYQMVVTPNDPDVRKRDKVKRYLGLLITPGKALQLNVKLSKGQGVEQIGEDAVEYPNVIIVSEMFAKMQKQLDDQKKLIDDLKKQIEELKKK